MKKLKGRRCRAISSDTFLTYGRAHHVGGGSLAVGSRRRLTVPVTWGTLDEIKRVAIAVERSVEVAPLLVARLSIAAVSCDSAK